MNDLDMEKIKRALLSLQDLKESGLYDYYSTTHNGQLNMSRNYGWNNMELDDMIFDLRNCLTNNEK